MISALKINNLNNKVNCIDNKQLTLETKQLALETNLINKIDEIKNYEKKLIDTEKKINNLEDKLIDIDEKINNLINLITEDVKKNCEKMSSHIDFIETIYDKVKAPMDYICSKFNNLMLMNNE